MMSLQLSMCNLLSLLVGRLDEPCCVSDLEVAESDIPTPFTA